MPSYTVEYVYEIAGSAFMPDSERYGAGTREIDAEREPESQEEFTEIAKTIFRAGRDSGKDYTKLVVKRVYETPTKPLDLDTVRGEIIDGE